MRVGIAEAKIQKTADGSADDLKPGSRVTATGRQAADGSYSASAIKIIPEGDQTAPTASGTGKEAGPT